MALRIRLRRMGKKKRPFYRIVVAEARAPRDGRFVETLGWYNPLTEPPSYQVDVERARFWLERGAQPTEAVARILRKVHLLPPAPWEKETAPAQAAPATGG
jgi:small subunit ribosomal protein S16